MSWLKNAVTKVGEKAEAIKHSERFQRLQERTSVVVASAAEGVKRAREKIGRPANAIEFEAQLESRAKSTRTLASIVEMHKSWVQSISAGNKEGPRVVSGDHELGFKEMFLQSRALEYSMEVIVSEPSLREQYMDPPNPDDKTSAIACLYELFSKTLAFPAPQWQGLLRVAMTGGLPREEQAAWLTTAITAMKADWSEEVLYTERKELALRAEFLKQELKQLEATDAEEATKKRIDTSAQLLRTYDAVRQNLQTSQAQRDEVRQLREQELLTLQQQIQARMVGLQSFADSCTSQQRDLEGELNQSQDSIKLQLEHMDEVRAGIDKEIDELDERKRQLRIELDTVSRQLDEARMKQKQHMESCDRQRAEFYHTKAALKEKLDAANTDGAAKAKEKELLDQTRQLIEETSVALQATVREQTEELQQKQAEFQSHFKLLLLDHLRYAEGRAKDLQAEAQKAAASQDPGAKEAARVAAQGAADALDELCKDIDFLGDSSVKAQLENLRVAHSATLALLGAPASAASAPAAAAATAATASPTAAAEAPYPSQSAAQSSQQVPII